MSARPPHVPDSILVIQPQVERHGGCIDCRAIHPLGPWQNVIVSFAISSRALNTASSVELTTKEAFFPGRRYRKPRKKTLFFSDIGLQSRTGFTIVIDATI